MEKLLQKKTLLTGNIFYSYPLNCHINLLFNARGLKLCKFAIFNMLFPFLQACLSCNILWSKWMFRECCYLLLWSLQRMACWVLAITTSRPQDNMPDIAITSITWTLTFCEHSNKCFPHPQVRCELGDQA